MCHLSPAVQVSLPHPYARPSEDKHITVAYKTADLESRGLHQTIHGYLRPDGSVRASAAKHLSSDNYCPYPPYDKPMWPESMVQQVIVGRSAGK